MNIKREFLYNEQKLLPLTLIKTNYGISPSNPSGTFEEDQTNTIDVDIDFPVDSSSIVMLIDKEQSPPKIVEVRSAPPGSSKVTLTIGDRTKYWVYVVSKEYNDGYIGGDYIVGSDVVTGDRFEFSYEDAPQQIDLTVDGRLTKSIDETDLTQWYNYSGYYNGPLVWYYPSTVNGSPIGNENFWMIVRQEILSQIDNIIKQNDLNTFSVTRKDDVVKVHRILDDLAEFMQDRKAEYDAILGDNAHRISDIWNFINAKIPGFGVSDNPNENYYLTYGEKISDLIDELGVYADHIRMDRLDSSTYPLADTAGQYVAATNQGLSHPLQYQEDSDTPRTVTYNLLGLTDSTRFKGLYGGGKEARATISGIWEGINWSRGTRGGSNGVYDERFRPAWNKFRSNKTKHIKDINNKLFNDYAYPIYVFNGDAQTVNNTWWEQISEISKGNWADITIWLDEKKQENLTNMAIVGDSVFVSGSSSADTTSNVDMDTQFTAQLALLQNIRYLKNQLASVDENLWTTMNSTSALMLASVLDISNKLEENKETNTIVNITSSKPLIGNIEILWKRLTGEPSGWNTLQQSISDIGEDTILINASIPDFERIGKYVVIVRPTRHKVNILSNTGEYVIIRDDLNAYQSPNYFYGWNAQLYTPQGDIFGGQKVIVESKWRSSDQYLKLTPLHSGSTEIDVNSKIELWSNDFIPITIDLDVVEHNSLTLSYSLYGKKEMNSDTGLCIIYDHNGNVYKQLSFGKYSNAQTGNAIIEYRTPEKNPKY